MAIIYSTIIAYETHCYSPLPVGSVTFSFDAKRSSELRVDAGVAECQWQQQGDRGAVSRRAWPPRDTCDDRPWNLRKLRLASPKVERINYYDDYNFFEGPSFKEYTNVNLMRKKNAQNATGHPTGSVTLTTGSERLYGVTYYTAKGLPCDTRQSCLGGKLDRALFDGGFCLLSGQHTAYCYYVCDHLGSVREVVSDAWNVQRNGYYAYGGPYGGWNTNADVQPLKFLGKEWDHQHGLDLYDFGARLYDPAVGRWTTMDPLCEKYYSVSPYAYCHDNPINRIDPDGKDVLIWYQDKRGNNQYFVFDGTQRRVPNNRFVLDFVHTYNYLKANKAGRNITIVR